MFKKIAAWASSLTMTDNGKFPGFDMFHAHCELTMTVNKPCSEVYTSVDDIVVNNKDTASPSGTYKPHDKMENEFVWAVRTTANGMYDDDVIFEMSDADGNCQVHSRSRSKTPSVLDNNVNFCNQFNVMKQVYSDIEGDAGKDKYQVGSCPHNQFDFTACGRY